MTPSLRILHLEDDRLDAELVRDMLAVNEIVADIDVVDRESAYVEQLAQHEFDLILADYALPTFNGGAALKIARQRCPDTPFIFVSGTLGEDVAAEALKSGATDYVLKHRLQKLPFSVRRAISEVYERGQNRRATEALRESEARYRLLFESNPQSMWVYDLETLRFLAVNEAAIFHYGYSREEFLAMTFKDIDPVADVPALLNKVTRGEQGIDQAVQRRHRTRNGFVIDVEITSHVIEFSGRPAEIVLANDITKRKRIEQQLRLQGAALEAAANAILITDANGNIDWVNPAFTASTGYSASEVLGKTARLLKSGRQAEQFYEELWQTILSGQVWHNVLVNKRKDGTLIHQELTITPIPNSEGEVAHFIGIAQDISELKRTEQALRETNQHLGRALVALQTKSEELASMTQQLWQASKLATMGELAASIAHELNNPLATVSLRVETLLLGLPENDPQHGPLNIISQEVDRMATLVNNLLQFSRRSHRQVSTVDLREEIANSIEFVHYHLRNRSVEIVREFAPEVPTVQADRQQLRQLFLNLLTNASDAMPKGGTLIVRVSGKTCGTEADGVVIEFADTGEGIAPEDIKKIWEPFFTTKPEGRGTGLGLAICRRIVEEHGGAIDIKSEFSKGTVVRFTLPATSSGAVQHLL